MVGSTTTLPSSGSLTTDQKCEEEAGVLRRRFRASRTVTMAAFGNFCPKNIWDKSQFYIPTSKNQKIWRHSRYVNFKSWSNCLYLFWYFTVLKLRFVLHTFWTNIPKISHCVSQEPRLEFFGFRHSFSDRHIVYTWCEHSGFYKTKQKFSCSLEGLKYTKLFCLPWGGWQFLIVIKFLSNYCCLEQGCRPWGCRGCHVPQILADQLTLSPPEGADYAHQIILALPDFQTFLRDQKSCQLSNLERQIHITWVKLSVLSPFVLIWQLYCYFLFFDLKWQALTQISQYFFSLIFNWCCIDKIIVVRWQYGSALVIKKLACFSLALVKVQRCLIIGANRSSKTQTWPTLCSSCLIFYQIKNK